MNLNDKMKIEKSEVRYHFDEQSGEFYFSIVDIIDTLELSKDPRNYWKVLKNRFKNSDNKLVTECNQLKMKSSDGKYYLTDVGSSGTILEIVQTISPSKVAMLEEFLNSIERGNSNNKINYFSGHLEEDKISIGSSNDDGEIKLDMYQKDNFIFVNLMATGVSGENIFISLNCKTLTVRFNRQDRNDILDENYEARELAWGKFSRTLSLPYEIDIDRVETTFEHGLLFIKLIILDKTRTKIVKVI